MDRPGSGRMFFFVCALASAPAIYVLSLGPAVLILDDATVEAVYCRPLSPLTKCKPVGDGLNYYIRFWYSMQDRWLTFRDRMAPLLEQYEPPQPSAPLPEIVVEWPDEPDAASES